MCECLCVSIYNLFPNFVHSESEKLWHVISREHNGYLYLVSKCHPPLKGTRAPCGAG